MTETTAGAMGRFHVVCHDCPHERVVTDDETARTAMRDHAVDTGHSVESERIA